MANYVRRYHAVLASLLTGGSLLVAAFLSHPRPYLGGSVGLDELTVYREGSIDLPAGIPAVSQEEAFAARLDIEAADREGYHPQGASYGSGAGRWWRFGSQSDRGAADPLATFRSRCIGYAPRLWDLV